MIGSQIARVFVDAGQKPIVCDVRPQYDAINQIVSLKKIEVVEANLLQYKTLEDVVKAKNVNRIVHTAANPLLNVGAQDNPHSAIEINIMGTANVLEICRKQKLNRMVFLSTAALYMYKEGGSEADGLSEDNYPHPTRIYPTTKLACENLGFNYSQLYGVDFVALRLIGVFGPWNGRGGGGRSNMIRELLEKVDRGQEAAIDPWVGELVYSKDVARAALLATEKEKLASRIYNVGMGRVYRPEEIKDIVKQRKPNAKINIQDTRVPKPANVQDKPINLTRSRKELGYEPMYDMPKAIDDLIESRRQLPK